MIVKTCANYQEDGGYIEAGISNNVIKFKTENIDMNMPIVSSNVYGALVKGAVKLNGSSAPAGVPCVVVYTGSHRYIGSEVASPDTTTQVTWPTEVDMALTNLISTAGYTTPVLSSNSKKCSMLKVGATYFITITGDDFLIDIVEGA